MESTDPRVGVQLWRVREYVHIGTWDKIILNSTRDSAINHSPDSLSVTSCVLLF